MTEIAIHFSAVGSIHQTKLLSVLEQSRRCLHSTGSVFILSIKKFGRKDKAQLTMNDKYCGVLFLQGKMDAAASMIEKAIVANPTYAEAYNNLGLSLSLSQRIMFFAMLR